MKIVKEHINEIKKGLTNIFKDMNVGHTQVLKQWADRYIGEGDYKIENEIIYPADYDTFSVNEYFLGIIRPEIKVIVIKPIELVKIGDIIHYDEKDINLKVINIYHRSDKGHYTAFTTEYGDIVQLYDYYSPRFDYIIEYIFNNEDKFIYKPYDEMFGIIDHYIYNEK